MKTFVILVCCLFFAVSIVSAKEEIFFMRVPSHISIAEAVDAVSQAAFRRRWSVEGGKNGILRITLNHRGYKAVLDFSFSNGEIHYSDLTTRIDRASPDNGSGRPGWSGVDEWVRAATPKSWIRNLKKDTSRFLVLNKANGSSADSFSHKSVEEKLVSLKKLYDEGLITESEYKLKKVDILSQY